MRQRPLTATLATLLFLLPAGGALAQYDYGGGASYLTDEGFVVEVEAGIANPRNTDNIVAALGPNVVIPEWDDDPAARVGFGYRFADGGRVSVALWGFDTDQSAEGVGSFVFPIGPVSGFGFDVTTEIEAQLVDVAWSQIQPVTSVFHVEWSVGLRHASFEETTTGLYDISGGPAVPYKVNEGSMLGARIGGQATRRIGSFSVGAGVGLSLLDGETETTSMLTPQPAGTAALFLKDDSRSGSIIDLDVRAAWHNSDDSLSIWIGWEEQIWDEIAADMARNLPGSAIVARDRDSVVFSWLKVGTSFQF